MHLGPLDELAARRSSRRNSPRPTKWYSRPVLLLAARLRVVCEIETTRCESSSSSALTRLDLPVPLGRRRRRDCRGSPWFAGGGVYVAARPGDCEPGPRRQILVMDGAPTSSAARRRSPASRRRWPAPRPDAVQRIELAWYQRERDTRRRPGPRAGRRSRVPSWPGLRRARARPAGAGARPRRPAVRPPRRSRARSSPRRAAFATGGDGIGLGDAHLLDAELLDQTGGDRLGAVRRAEAAYTERRRRTAPLLAGTWAASHGALPPTPRLRRRWEGGPAGGRRPRPRRASAPYVEACRATPPGGAAIRARRSTASCAPSRPRGAAARCSRRSSRQNIGIGFSLLNDYEGALHLGRPRPRALVAPTGWPYATGWCLMQTGSILVGLGRARAANGAAAREHASACEAFTGFAQPRARLPDPAARRPCSSRRTRKPLRWCEAAHRGARRCTPGPGEREPALHGAGLVAPRPCRRGPRGSARGVGRCRGRARLAPGRDHPPCAGRDRPPARTGARDSAGRRHPSPEAARSRRPHARIRAAAGLASELAAAYEVAGDLPSALRCERAAPQARAQRTTDPGRADGQRDLLRHRAERAVAEARAHQRALALGERPARRAGSRPRPSWRRSGSSRCSSTPARWSPIGRLAAGVAHEMSHPVGTLLLLAQALDGACSVDAPREVGDALATLVGETPAAAAVRRPAARLRARSSRRSWRATTCAACVADARQLFAPRLALDRIDYARGRARPARARSIRSGLALAVANLVLQRRRRA